MRERRRRAPIAAVCVTALAAAGLLTGVLFPGLRQQYERQYGDRYSAAARGARRLEQTFREACERKGIATRMPFYEPAQPLQPALF